jgi:hypothetical protein
MASFVISQFCMIVSQEACTNSSNLVVSFPSLAAKRLLNSASKLFSPDIVLIEAIICFALSPSSHSSGNNS